MIHRTKPPLKDSTPVVSILARISRDGEFVSRTLNTSLDQFSNENDLKNK